MAELEDAAAAKEAAKEAMKNEMGGAALGAALPILIADVESESIVDGPGFRFAIYTQGCPHHCPECHNPQTHAFEGGMALAPEQLMAYVHKSPLQKGITLTGGEPLCQARALIPLVQMAREQGYNIWIYSGYLYEQVYGLPLPADHPTSRLGADAVAPDGARELLDLCDVLVDGPFIAELKSLDIKWRGSKNQRCIDLTATRAQGMLVLR